MRTCGETRSPKKLEARSTGVRGEIYAYWYLRRPGYVFVAKSYMPRGVKGESDLVGYHGKTLAFVEVRTRTVKEDAAALPELSVTQEKERMVIRTAQRFLAERHVEQCPVCFEVVAIDNHPGQPPIVRLHKDAFSPQHDRPYSKKPASLLCAGRSWHKPTKSKSGRRRLKVAGEGCS